MFDYRFYQLSPQMVAQSLLVPGPFVFIEPAGAEFLFIVSLETVEPHAEHPGLLIVIAQYIFQEHIQLSQFVLGQVCMGTAVHRFGEVVWAEGMAGEHDCTNILFFGYFQEIIALNAHDIEHDQIVGF